MNEAELTALASRIMDLHRDGIAQYGGESGRTDEGCVRGAIGNAYQAALYIGDDDVVDSLQHAAYITYYLVSNHCFTDGNKRVGWMALVDILLANGLVIDATQAEAVEFVLAIAKGDIHVEGMLAWLAEHLVADDLVEPF